MEPSTNVSQQQDDYLAQGPISKISVKVPSPVLSPHIERLAVQTIHDLIDISQTMDMNTFLQMVKSTKPETYYKIEDHFRKGNRAALLKC